MKKTIFGTGILLFYVLTAIGNDSTHVKSYAGISSGIVHFYGLETFNESLIANTIDPIAATNLSAAFNYVCQIPRMDIRLDFSMLATGNKAQKPMPRVQLNCYVFSLNLGYNLLHSDAVMRLTPFAGISVPFTQLIMTSHDSTITTTELVSGAQNMYFEQPRIEAMLDAGLRLNYFFRKTNHRFGIALQTMYSYQPGTYRWTIPDMPIHKLNSLNFSLSLLYRMKN